MQSQIPPKSFTAPRVAAATAQPTQVHNQSTRLDKLGDPRRVLEQRFRDQVQHGRERFSLEPDPAQSKYHKRAHRAQHQYHLGNKDCLHPRFRRGHLGQDQGHQGRVDVVHAAHHVVAQRKHQFPPRIVGAGVVGDVGGVEGHGVDEHRRHVNEPIDFGVGGFAGDLTRKPNRHILGHVVAAPDCRAVARVRGQRRQDRRQPVQVFHEFRVHVNQVPQSAASVLDGARYSIVTSCEFLIFIYLFIFFDSGEGKEEQHTRRNRRVSAHVLAAKDQQRRCKVPAIGRRHHDPHVALQVDQPISWKGPVNSCSTFPP
ncbi:hypothetical protein BC828DRAFT_386453 [Blastocladiella britannica]|nr:hypothetical protein BC828DRAFT_386453 [Blastocladiella britannica]